MVNIVLLILCIATIIVPFVMGMKCPMKDVSRTFTSKAKPPDKVFGMVWGLLYVLMAISLYMLASTPRTKTNAKWIRVAILAAAVGYILNYLYIYFSGCRKEWVKALYIFIAYLILIPFQIMITFACNPLAGVLLAPLLGWGTYAIMLNALYVDQYMQ